MKPPPRRCPHCLKPAVQVVNSKVAGQSRIRYYGCGECGKRPPDNKRIVPLEFAPQRKAA